MKDRQIRTVRFAFALLALVLLSFATVRATVMQVAMALDGSTITCGMDMTGGSTAGSHTSQPDKPVKHHESCPFCALARCSPLGAATIALPAPTSIAWVAWRPDTPIRSREPPSFRANARGPPVVSLIV